MCHNVSLQEALGSTTSQNCLDTGINFRFHAAPAQYESRRRIGRRPDVETGREKSDDGITTAGPVDGIKSPDGTTPATSQQLLHRRHDRFIAGPPAARLTGRTLLRDMLIEIS